MGKERRKKGGGGGVEMWGGGRRRARVTTTVGGGLKSGAAGEREGALWVVRCGCGDGGGDRAKFARGRWTLRLSACFARRVRTRARGKPADFRRRCG